MWRAVRIVKFAAGLGAMMLVIAACSTDVATINIVPKAGDILRPDWTSFSGHKEEFDLRPPGPRTSSVPMAFARGLLNPRPARWRIA